jgi:hypothetical protein
LVCPRGYEVVVDEMTMMMGLWGGIDIVLIVVRKLKSVLLIHEARVVHLE